MRYTVIIEEGPTSYGAYVPDLLGCVAAADTKEEAVRLIHDAIVGHLELMAEYGSTYPSQDLRPSWWKFNTDNPGPAALGHHG